MRTAAAAGGDSIVATVILQAHCAPTGADAVPNLSEPVVVVPPCLETDDILGDRGGSFGSEVNLDECTEEPPSVLSQSHSVASSDSELNAVGPSSPPERALATRRMFTPSRKSRRFGSFFSDAVGQTTDSDADDSSDDSMDDQLLSAGPPLTTFELVYSIATIKEARRIMALAAPQCFTLLCINLNSAIVVVFVGRGGMDQLAAIGFGNAVMFGSLLLITGISSPLAYTGLPLGVMVDRLPLVIYQSVTGWWS